jgi:sugar lactone lactonase YvrE
MDGIQFDSLARALHSPAARRSALGLLLGSTFGLLDLAASEAKGKKGKKITLCLNGQTLSVKKSKKGKLLKQGAVQGACASSPPVSPPPASPPPPAGRACPPPCTGNTLCRNGQCRTILGYEFVTAWGNQGSGLEQFQSVSGLALDLGGNLIVADPGNKRVQRFSPTGNLLTTITEASGGADLLIGPTAVAIGRDGSLYVVDDTSEVEDRVVRYNADGNFFTDWALAADDFLETHFGIAVDAENSVYVTDSDRDLVQKFTNGGDFLTEWGDEAQGPRALSGPLGIAADSDGNILVVDTNHDRVVRFDSFGNFISAFGSETFDPSGFVIPTGIGVDTQGNIFVADVERDRISKFDAAGNVFLTWGSRGGDPGQFRFPGAVVVDQDGFVYVADAGNRRIQKFRPVFS